MDSIGLRLKKNAGQIDFVLLLFLVFFTVDMVILKPVALVAALFWCRKQVRKEDLKASPVFYIALPLLAVVNFLFFNSDFSGPHLISLAVGCGYWLMSFFAFVLIRVRLREQGQTKTEHTLILFFWLNFLVSLYNLFHTMYTSGSINPYGLLEVDYGNSTGDYIRGIFLAPCYINTFVNCGFAFYFLYRKRFVLSFFAVVVACLTTSNFASLMLIVLLLAALVFVKVRRARLTVLVQLAFIAIFYLFVSTNNLNYMMTSILGKEDSVEMAALRKLQEEMYRKLQTALSVFEDRKLDSRYGKGIATQLTYYYLKSSPKRALMGAGMGEFSSQLAVRTSDLKGGRKSRFFAMLPVYISPDFLQNHYQVFSVIYSLPEEYHSIRHLPNSFVNQIFGEYGILGFLAFLIFYVWFFLRRIRKLSYSIFIGIMMAYFLLFDYMFEYLSLVVFFELFFLTDLQRQEQKEAIQ
jgi:hypothetical protein